MISSLESPQIRALSIAELALGGSALPVISIEVSGLINASFEASAGKVCKHSALLQDH